MMFYVAYVVSLGVYNPPTQPTSQPTSHPASRCTIYHSRAPRQTPRSSVPLMVVRRFIRATSA